MSQKRLTAGGTTPAEQPDRAERREPTADEIAERKLYREMGLTDDEYARAVRLLGRRPNYTETGLFAVMWSEHCSYKNSKPVLKRFPTTGPRVLQGPGEGAGIVDIGDGLAVVFKIESHNHPSAVEPFQGAATGVGGIIRDVFSMGARPIALLNALRFGELDSPRVRYLFEQVVAGIAHYGNCVGIPTVGGEVVFDPCYEGNPLVNAMCVGLLRHEHIRKGVARGAGNPVVYVGSATGRDGIHGATFASEELSEASEEKRPAVQVGDPFAEKLLLEACLELIDRGLVLGIQDMGAAGLTSSSAEMASKGGCGIELDLDRVPQREPNLTPYEMMLSESQERMLLVVEKGKEEEVLAVCRKWGLHAAVIGRVTGDGLLRVRHQGAVAAEVPVKALTDGAPVYTRPVVEPAYFREQAKVDVTDLPEPEDLGAVLTCLLAQPTIASKEWVYRQYDHQVQAQTAVCPGSDAAVVWIRGTRKALAFSTDGNGRYVYLDPLAGGALAVAEAARNVVCAGAEPLALTNCLNFGNPEKPGIYWQFVRAVEGMARACEALGTPVVSGNVSFYNETNGAAVYPTPIVGMVGLIEDVAHITTQAFKGAGARILLLGETAPDDLGGSEYQKLVRGTIAGRPPKLDLERERAVQRTVLEAIRRGWVTAAHDLSEGGLGVALAEMAISGGVGARVELETDLRPDFLLFSESPSRVLISVPASRVADVMALAEERGVPCADIGETGGEDLVIAINGQVAVMRTLKELKDAWTNAIPARMNG